MTDTAILDRPVEDKPKPKEPFADGGKHQPPKKPNDKTKYGFARNEDESDDPWGALGIQNPWTQDELDTIEKDANQT